MLYPTAATIRITTSCANLRSILFTSFLGFVIESVRQLPPSSNAMIHLSIVIVSESVRIAHGLSSLVPSNYSVQFGLPSFVSPHHHPFTHCATDSVRTHIAHLRPHNSLSELDLLWKGAAIQKKVPVIPGNLASVGFGFNQEDCFIRTDDNTCPVVVMGQRDEDG